MLPLRYSPDAFAIFGGSDPAPRMRRAIAAPTDAVRSIATPEVMFRSRGWRSSHGAQPDARGSYKLGLDTRRHRPKIHSPARCREARSTASLLPGNGLPRRRNTLQRRMPMPDTYRERRFECPCSTPLLGRATSRDLPWEVTRCATTDWHRRMESMWVIRRRVREVRQVSRKREASYLRLAMQITLFSCHVLRMTYCVLRGMTFVLRAHERMRRTKAFRRLNR